METAINFIEQGKHYGSVLVHCHKGISRSASFIIGYLMKKNSFTFIEALSHVQTCRPIVQPNDSFTAQLINYEVLLNNNDNDSIIIDKNHSIGSTGPSLCPTNFPIVYSKQYPLGNYILSNYSNHNLINLITIIYKFKYL